MGFKIRLSVTLLGLVAFLAGALALAGLSIGVWEYTNSDTFCGTACHNVHPQEPAQHLVSQHANVRCVECHIGRMDFLDSAIAKSGHITHAWSVVFGYERPTYARSLKSAERSCEACHPPTTHRNNSLRIIKRYDTDRDNTEHRILLTMRLAGREFGGESHRGINWHASGAVRFAADGPHALEVHRVVATLPDGTTEEFHNVRDEEGAGAGEELRTMDCLSCHNRAGHAFPNPEDVIDEALAEGQLDRGLPFIKKKMLEIVGQPVESEEQARTLAMQEFEKYLQEYPEAGERLPSDPEAREKYIAREVAATADLMSSSQHLESEDVDWSSFPDQLGHRDAPGCFRCHNGRLQTAEGRPIPVNCTTCHSIPLISQDGGIPPYYLQILDVRKPESHQDPAFMSQHMDLAEDACGECHGEIDWGDEDQGHCSNSACHGRTWEYLDLDALR